MQIALYQPQIPQNTGNIARTCAVTGSSLRLIPPMGFTIDERQLKRAGLDYWPLLDVQMVDNLEAWLDDNSSRLVFFSSHSTKFYTEFSYCQDSILVFGSETQGLPASWRQRWPDQFVRLPMVECEQARCLNLATCVGIALYEALRQTGFQNLY